MTLDEAIKHCEEVAHEKRIESSECISVNDLENAEACYECGEAHKQLASWLTELKQRRESEKQELEINPWIPVDDALPEIGYSVLVTRQTESNTRYVRIASRQDDCWMDNADKYGKPNPHPVIAWMPIPNAYDPPNNMIGD